MNTRKNYRNFGANMICKKCGHDVTKHDVIYADSFCEKCHNVKTNPYCPCGEKL